MREVERFIDSHVVPSVPPLLRVSEVELAGTTVKARTLTSGPVTDAVWWSTESPGPYHRDNPGKDDPVKTTVFHAVPAQWTPDGDLGAVITPATKVGFFEVTDAAGAKTTSEIRFFDK